MNSGGEIMNDGDMHSRLKYLLEGAVPEIPAAGKWSRVEVRVRRLRRRRRFLRTGSALLAFAVLVPAGLWVRTEIVDPGQSVLITALSAEDQATLAEIRALHADWKSGKIEIDWPPPGVDATNAPYPTDLEELFQWLEQGVFSPEVTVFLKDEVDAAEELQAEIAGWPEVIGVRFVSKDEALARLRADLTDHADLLDDLPGNPLPASIEITVSDYTLSATVGERLQGRPEVDEVRWAGSHYPYEGLVAWLRSQAHLAGETLTTKIWAETTTTSGEAQANASTSVSGTTSTVTTLLQRELKWGETATAVGGTVTVGAPVADPAAQAEQPGFTMVSCVVTLANTGEAPITYSAFDFSLEGRSSGGTGRDTQFGSGGLGRGTLAPGSTVTGTVFFPLHEGDVPVVVWLINPWSERERLSWR